jgi:glucose-1-phosphatase
MKKIKAFIFDFGGVLYDIDPMKTIYELSSLSSDEEFLKKINIEKVYRNPIFLEYEQGLTTTEEHRFKIRKLFNITSYTDQEIDNAWNKTLIAPFADSLNIVTEFKTIGKIYLLSNTNEIHYNYFSVECKELLALFDSCFFSYKMKMRKPELEIYRTVLNFIGFEPHETLFIDDSISNIIAAESLGISVWHITAEKKLSDLLHTVK